jgi:hypothetical protein
MSDRIEMARASAPPMDRYEARALIDTVKRDVARTWDHLQELYRRRAHEALGYTSFAECLRVEFDVAKSTAYQMVAHARVTEEIEAQSAIADSPLPPVPNEAVARELAKDPAPAEAWVDVVEINGNTPTAKQTRAMVQERQLKDPATDKQVREMERLGIPPDVPVSKKTASKRIGEMRAHHICTCAVCGDHYNRETGRRL